MTGKKFKSVGIILQEAKDQLERQLNAQNLIVAKAAIILAVCSVVLSAEIETMNLSATIVLFIALIGSLSALFCILPKTVNLPPNLEKLYSQYIHEDGLYTQRALLDRYISASKQMIKDNERRAKMLVVSMICLLGLILLQITQSFMIGGEKDDPIVDQSLDNIQTLSERGRDTQQHSASENKFKKVGG